MMDKITPGNGASPIPVKSSSSTKEKRLHGTAALESESEEAGGTLMYQRYPFVERRSGKDRRQRGQKRVIYDMRQNGGRRKTDRKYPPIETDA